MILRHQVGGGCAEARQMIKLGKHDVSDTSLRFKLHSPARSWIERALSLKAPEESPTREIVEALLDRKKSSKPRRLGKNETESRYDIGFVRNYFICGVLN